MRSRALGGGSAEGARWKALEPEVDGPKEGSPQAAGGLLPVVEPTLRVVPGAGRIRRQWRRRRRACAGAARAAGGGYPSGADPYAEPQQRARPWASPVSSRQPRTVEDCSAPRTTLTAVRLARSATLAAHPPRSSPARPGAHPPASKLAQAEERRVCNPFSRESGGSHYNPQQKTTTKNSSTPSREIRI